MSARTFRELLPSYSRIIGLCGSIASGKSHAREHLATLGAVTIDADKLGHRAYEKGSLCFGQLVTAFSSDILSPDGEFASYRPICRLPDHWRRCIAHPDNADGFVQGRLIVERLARKCLGSLRTSFASTASCGLRWRRLSSKSSGALLRSLLLQAHPLRVRSSASWKQHS
jgi:hypothetical protein